MFLLFIIINVLHLTLMETTLWIELLLLCWFLLRSSRALAVYLKWCLERLLELILKSRYNRFPQLAHTWHTLCCSLRKHKGNAVSCFINQGWNGLTSAQCCSFNNSPRGKTMLLIDYFQGSWKSWIQPKYCLNTQFKHPWPQLIWWALFHWGNAKAVN